MDILERYVREFNENDEETVCNLVDNANALEWLRDEIPLFECPDADIERAYYFRWWTYRKHLKYTEDGYVVSEFLPNVPWSGPHNVINAAVGHHLAEGRWLKHSERYLSDYIDFFLNRPDSAHQYSAWLADAMWKLANVTGHYDVGRETLQKLVRYYELWEETHGLPNGMFWSIDDRDAMEYSISGTTEDGRVLRGIRPTLNSYLCADAAAIARFARIAGDRKTEARFLEKHDRLKKSINENLFEDGFYRAYHCENGKETDPDRVILEGRGHSPRELIGYLPWMFGIPPVGRDNAFDLLADERSFASPYGLATAERSHPRFLYSVKHECLWNGYVWPFATSQTLTALNNVIQTYPNGERYRDLFCKLLRQYAKSHTRLREDGKTVPWIDEVRHPLRDEWSSRTLLRDWGWPERKGGYERGKDYNHSTFCDLAITGIVGVRETEGALEISPNIPADWGWFRLSDLHYKGKTYTVVYDKTGEKFGVGHGLQVTEQT